MGYLVDHYTEGTPRTMSLVNQSTSSNLEIIHHDGHDPSINSPFVPAIRASAGTMVFISGVSASPTYHDHPHVPEVFDAIPRDIEGQLQIIFDNLDQRLEAAGCSRSDVVYMTRFFTNVDEDQDTVNKYQKKWFQGHVPTSASVEVTRMAADPKLRLEIQSIAVKPPSA
ncbi:RidA family protein [Georgenia yuyongxinii]|uniref:RidA family protein n=1 Tax=Georgenia yuyongxinii TaxID=2589797 RepID=A0A5B8C3T5_9MICO|nr:RidA family protein [Georgenia yuyongxinii]QDC24938.1 RidA family protein [Georgenia yuyongxinii]